MTLIRFLRRFLLLLAHTGRGIRVSLRQLRAPLPDPEPVSAWSRRLLEILGVELECHGQPPTGSALIVANHLSWLDIPVIAACSRAAFLSKESIRRWPLIGWFARAAGTLFIRRGKGEAKQVSRAIAQRLALGRQMAIFPEGRIGDNHEVQRFFPPLFAAAIDAHVPVVPVALRYGGPREAEDAVLYRPGRSFLGILFRLLARPRTRASLFFCPPISPEGRDRRALARAARQAILEALSGGEEG